MPRVRKFESADAEVFRNRIIQRSTPVPEAGCWFFDGALNGPGLYGAIAVRRRIHAAHRVSWMAFKGEIPKGMIVMHKCDVPFCVNPDHLSVGSQKDNCQDKIKKGRASPPPAQVLTPRDAEEIRRLHRALVIDLSEKHRVRPATIRAIISRRIWVSEEVA